ncbi:MAG: N-acetylmuramoyl-L-alanine amidase [Acidobacteria bacterium]|nr:N-acetylmuramoyl-L-alanine amidase [Acidobacteriota bacterium]
MRDLGVPKFGTKKLAFHGKAMSGWLRLAAVVLLVTSGFGRSTAARLDQAREYFEKATAARAALEQTPPEKRTEKDYSDLMESYRRVYFTAPTYGNDTICLMAIGGLAEEAARRFAKPQYFQKAIDSYEFLLKEYPQSQFRFEALFSIARIYREDLRQPASALEQYERYRKTYPGSAQSRQVEVAIAQLRDEIGSPPAAAAEHDPSQSNAKPESAAANADPLSSPKRNDPAVTATSSAPATVSDIRFWRTPDYTRVVLETGQQVKYQVGRVESPDRLYLDLYDTRVSPPSGKTVSVEDDMLRSIRVAQFNASTSRVVLDLAGETEFAISELTNPYRLVIDVHGISQQAALPPSIPASVTEKSNGKAEQPALKQTEPAPKPTEKDQKKVVAAAARQPAVASAAASKTPENAAEKPSAQEKPEPVQVADATPAAAPDKIKAADPIRGGAHSLTRALGLKIGRILIDPGHGGHDTGTIGPSGYTEKELVLDVSQRLGKLIEDRLGSEVVYTRDEDSFIALEDRAALANKKQADLFLSIHANSSRSKTAAGIETYYLSLTSDPEALEVAARENAVSQETISELQGLVQKIALNEKVDESKEFASKVHASLRKSLASGRPKRFDRGVKKAPFVVLIGANMPAILSEISFLSNPEEEKRLKTPEQRQKIAEALYAGVSSYASTLSGVKSAPARAEKPEPTQTASLE